ncbi:substrate-binding domain-containing protein [Hydrocarboniphaga sp.]|uniref:LacI family DNA-binding transcriptional regulator n=1 Tax=Hydrocarboniphaga sp. TaxID=2033016 RepID=UPI002ABCF72B|nr:substrate-binding domain-containing protein [Hydrocarboniphaga sp.]MDZ4078911.1 substrate-binding domain-containing protein [Hydrocarboniphaga sp.]
MKRTKSSGSRTAAAPTRKTKAQVEAPVAPGIDARAEDGAVDESASGRPRLIDVARLAGVSLGSASRALSSPDAVRANTLRKVREAAERLGYVPDGAARALALRRSMTIGAVLPTINNPIFSDFVQALQKTLGRAGYHLLIAAHEYDLKEEAAVVERLVQRGIDGIVLIGTDHPSAIFRRIEQARLPYVCAWSVDEARAHPCVGISNRRAMHRVVRHLLDLGHRQFAMVSGDPEHNERARSRIEGVMDAFALADVEFRSDRIYYGPYSIEAGREALRKAMALKPRPTALICATDLLAAGALAEARAMGIQVPQQLSISGFDDIEIASLLDPPLTTLQVRTSEIGRASGEALLAAIKGKVSPTVEIETTLKVRGSTGPAPQR